MSERDQELERRLDKLFTSSQPRPGFEAELWERLRWRRPHGQHLRVWAPLAAAAAVLAVTGAGWLAVGHLATNPTLPTRAPAITGPTPASSPGTRDDGLPGMIQGSTACGHGPTVQPSPIPSARPSPCP